MLVDAGMLYRLRTIAITASLALPSGGAYRYPSPLQ
jgi:hypothetical protein